jgi:hypothetical protein
MGKVDYLGARGANAGDYFQELWTVRHALSLLNQDSELAILTVEGLRPEDEAGQLERNWDGVDCGLYYGAAAIENCQRIEIEQLKYSSADPERPWTIARLTQNTAKKGNNSVMRRLADAFRGVEATRGSTVGIVIRLVSNQPVAAGVGETLQAAIQDKPLTQSPEQAQDVDRVVDASGMSGDLLRKFIGSLDFSSQTGSRFDLEDNVLKAIAAWSDDDASVILNTLVRFVSRKMLPESKGEFIAREDVLVQFGFSGQRALFPCTSEIVSVNNPVPREVASAVVNEMRAGKKYICLHGTGGCGKTTVLQEIGSKLSQGSSMIAFDCYGAGRYLDSDAYRHRPKDAFLQLANDVATRLRVPLLLTRSKDVDYPRALGARLNRAAEILASNNKEALLVLAVDAADNSVIAANSITPVERTFVHDFVNLGSLPENVCLLVTARTGRLDQLNLPTRFHRVQIKGFTQEETQANVLRTLTAVPGGWLDDFHHLSGGNPRVQSYALKFGGGKLAPTLDYLRPGGKDLKQVFDQRLAEALVKSGGPATVDAFCAALVVLPRPIPREELAAISNLTMAQVNDICADLAPAIRSSGETVGFADEDFEHFVRERVADLDSVRARVAERFLTRHEVDAYAAAHLAPALHQASRGKEIIQLLETQAAPAAIADPLLRREVQLQRIRTAVQAASEQQDLTGALRIMLIGAEALKTDAALRALVIANPDLAAAFMLDSASKMILQDSNEVEHHGPLLFHRLRENAAAKSAVMAREDFRQLRAWIGRRSEDLARKKAEHPEWHHPDAWEIGNREVAAEVEATILLYGPEAALADLGRWKPRQLHLRVAQILVPRLLRSGNADLVEKCLSENLVPPPWDLALLVPLAVSGRAVDVSRFEKSITRLQRYMRVFSLQRLRDEWTPGLASFWFDTITTACEIVIGHAGSCERVRRVLMAFADKEFRRIDRLHVSQATLLDVLLRAHALLEEDAGRSISVDSFVTTPDLANLKDAPGAKPRRSENRDRDEEIRRTVGSLVPIYRTRAEILLGKVAAEHLDKSLAEAIGAFLHDNWQIARTLGGGELRKRAALSVASLIFDARLNPLILLERSLSLFEKYLDPYGSDETALLSVIALNKSSHERALALIVERSESVSAMRAPAREKIDAMLNLARFLDAISRSDAKALFGRAHSMTEEMDSEAIFLLKSIAALCVRAKTALEDQARRSVAAAFGAVATDAAIRLSDQEGFPWHSVTTGLTSLSLAVALSAIARWEDTCVGDWELCLRAAIGTALNEGTVNSEEAAALFSLIDDPQEELFSQIANRLDVGDAEKARAILDTLAKDELLRFGRGRRANVVRILSNTALGSKDLGPWLVHLQETSQFLSDRNAHKSEAPAPYGSEVMTPEAVRNVLSAMPGQQVTGAGVAATIRAVRQARGETVPYVSAQQVLEQIRSTISLNERVLHLQALIELPSADASENEVAAAVNVALREWASPGVNEWCRQQLPGFISRELPGLARWLVFERQAPIRSMVSFLALEKENVPKILIDAIASHVDDLGAEPVYAILSLIAEYLSEQVAAAVVQHYLPRCLARIPKKDLDQVDLGDVPLSSTSGLGRFLFALLSDCDVRIRWRVAHVLRRLARFRQTHLLHSVLDLYDRTAEPSFRAPNTPFYWIAARLWTMIAVDRIAAESPETLTAYGSRLLAIACDGAFPHVLIRGFAKDAVQKLSESGLVSPTRKQQKALQQVNLGKGTKKRVYAVGGGADPSHSRRERGFNFDSLDTLPYWYEPATRIFADVTMDEFTGAAENWIVTQWGVSTEIQRWKDEPRPQRFPEGRWALWSNGHGSRPTLERYFTYLEWHGMWCAVGTLLQSRPLASVEPEEYSSFENWLRGERLTRPPFWLCDLRAPKPLEPQLWSAPESEAWLATVEDQDFLREIGIGVGSKATIIVDAHHTTYASDFRSQVTVRSALVQAETASALVRAFQTTEEPYRYWIPYDRERDGGRLDEPPYRLLGWVGLSESDSGLDKGDPDCNEISGSHCAPGREATRGLVNRVSSDGMIEWSALGTGVDYCYRQWSDANSDEDDSLSRIVRSNGSRLHVSVDSVRSHLQDMGLDLVIKIELDRRKGDRYAGFREEETPEARFDRIVVLRRDGTIEGAEGPLGTWRPSGR